jgi:hypothetical protein
MEAESSACEGPNKVRPEEDMGLYPMCPLGKSHQSHLALNPVDGKELLDFCYPAHYSFQMLYVADV